jgi:hypothetical protein
MMFRGLAVLLALLFGLPAAASAQSAPPTPEPSFAVNTGPRPCTLERDDPYERSVYQQEGWAGPSYERYPGACERLRFSYGPITVKPGQNDVSVTPLTIEKPSRDGYITRIRPDLVRADGTVPPVEQIHLHHGTWLSVPSYGNGPFFAAGEEKTVAPLPRGYGMPVKASDQWLLLYMVHSAVAEPMETYIVYDVDFIPKDKGDAMGMKSAYPLWLDVRPAGYPVFNTQRKFGGDDDRCTWPKEQCANHDPYGKEIVGQGKPGNGKGEDLKLPEQGEEYGTAGPFNGGTIIGMGGHLHPGGIQNEIDLLRKKRDGTEKKRRIYTGQAKYWDRKDKSKWGGPPTSWDFSMPVVGLPFWGVRVKPGDVLRSNATQETKYQATYENMGIAVAFIAPDTPEGQATAPNINPFKVRKDRSDGCRSGGMLSKLNKKPIRRAKRNFAKAKRRVAGARRRVAAGKRRVAKARGEKRRAAKRRVTRLKGRLTKDKRRLTKAKRRLARARAKGGPKLCDKGFVTHGHLAENSNYGGPSGNWEARSAGQATEITIADFLYLPGDLSTRNSVGIPTVPLGSKLRFNNLEGGTIFHTITSCKYPCLGQTGAAFPLADGETSQNRQLDFDSSELGIGLPAVGPTKQELDYELSVTAEEGYKSGEVVTYFCRVHPFMRGGFEVK